MRELEARCGDSGYFSTQKTEVGGLRTRDHLVFVVRLSQNGVLEEKGPVK